MAKTSKRPEPDLKVQEVGAGPTVQHDELISQILARMAEEYARKSDAGESAAAVRQFLDDTSINSQAFSWAKSIMKKMPKKDGQSKAMDIIRSLNVLLPMIEAHVMGQGTREMDLDAAPKPLPKPTADVASPKDDDEPAEADEDLEEDTSDFDEAMDQLGGEDDEEDGDGEFESDDHFEREDA